MQRHAAVYILLALTCGGCGGSPPPAHTGLTILSNPPGAAIFLDGNDTLRRTPAAEIEASASEPGVEHILRLALAGYNDWWAVVRCYAGAGQTVTADLSPASAQAGSLFVISEPPGAQVTLDEVGVGVTPLDLSAVAASSHVLRVSAPGYDPAQETIVVAPGQRVEREVRLRATGAGAVSGTVFDVSATGVVGAQLWLEGESASVQGWTTYFGSFLLPSVPTGTYTLRAEYQGADAQLLVGSRGFVTVTAGEQRRNADLILVTPGQFGNVFGTVRREGGAVLAGALLYADAGLLRYETHADSQGNYSFGELPAFYYDLIACAAGHQSQTVPANVSPGGATRVDFTLAPSAGPAPEQPENLVAIAWTYPATVDQKATPALLRSLLEAAASGRRGLTAGGRSPEPGTLLEVDLRWAYTGGLEVSAFEVWRGEGLEARGPIGLLADPAAGWYGDIDPYLSAQVTYSYAVRAIGLDGQKGVCSEPTSARLLGRLRPLSPADGALGQALVPTFTWSALPEAQAYLVLMYDSWPEAGQVPIWRSAPVLPPQTSIAYGESGIPGPPLQSGTTYYWIVWAINAPLLEEASACSAAPLWRFTTG